MNDFKNFVQLQSAIAENMLWLKLIFCASAVFAVTHHSDEVKFEHNFRKIGKLAVGLTYAHMHATINLEPLEQSCAELMAHIVKKMMAVDTSVEERKQMESVIPQLQVATKIIQDINLLFFSENPEREKRQILAGLGLLSGLFSTGLSIYNRIELGKLDHEITSVREETVEGFRHVAHVLQEEDMVMHQVMKNVDVLKTSVQTLIIKLSHEYVQMQTLSNVLSVLTSTVNMGAQIAEAGRALESLFQCKLHPSLINAKSLENSIQRITEKAARRGLRLLHEDREQIFKSPISFIAKKDRKIVVIVHIPLTSEEPLNLYEHLAIPTRIEDIFVTIHSEKNLLATDAAGRIGLELAEFEMIRCQVHYLHSENLFICPNTNLLQKNMRKTCLGALFFSEEKEINRKCVHRIRHEVGGEMAQQTGKNSIVLYSDAPPVITESCQKKSRLLKTTAGITMLKTRPGCKLDSENFVFTSPQIVAEETDFLQKIIPVSKLTLFNGTSTDDLRQAYQNLRRMKNPEEINLRNLQNWIEEESKKTRENWGQFGIAGLGVAMALGVICYLGWMFAKHRRAEAAKASSST